MEDIITMRVRQSSDPETVRLALAILTGRKTKETFTARDLILLGHGYEPINEIKYPDSASLKMWAEDVIFYLLCPPSKIK
jgi:hypothetical protein